MPEPDKKTSSTRRKINYLLPNGRPLCKAFATEDVIAEAEAMITDLKQPTGMNFVCYFKAPPGIKLKYCSV